MSDQLDRSVNSLSQSTSSFSEPWELSAARRSVFQRFTEVKLLAGIPAAEDIGYTDQQG